MIDSKLFAISAKIFLMKIKLIMCSTEFRVLGDF
jgi:hypothetical protein